MCRPISKGGQRCAGHAGPKYDQARLRLEQAWRNGAPLQVVAAQEAWHAAAVEYASTPKGRREIEALHAEVSAAIPGTARLAPEEYATILREGDALAAANKEAAERIRASRGRLLQIVRGRDRAQPPVPYLGPSGGIIDMHRHEGQLLAAARALGGDDAAAMRSADEAGIGWELPPVGPSVPESEATTAFVRQMQSGGWTHFVVFDDEEPTPERIVMVRSDDEVDAVGRMSRSKSALRVRRADGTWPGPVPPKPLTDMGLPRVLR